MQKTPQKETKKEAPQLPKCAWCEIEFIPSHRKQLYCTDNHRQKAFQARQKQAAAK